MHRKAKMALEALKGDQTMVELSDRYQLHPNQITEWKKQLLEHAAEVFGKDREGEAKTCSQDRSVIEEQFPTYESLFPVQRSQTTSGKARARARIIFKTILGLLLVGVLISASSWGFAQGGSVSGSVKDLSNNQGIQGVIITVKDLSNSAVAGISNTDAVGNYSVSIPSLGNYTIHASKLGYYNLTTLEVIELSDMTPNRTANISMGGKSLFKEKSEGTSQTLSWETGTGKSYLIPALEIPAFLLLLNAFDRLAYPNDVEGGEKVYSTNLSTFRDNAIHGRWGVDQDSFAMNQFAHPYQGSIYHGFARSAGLNYWESLLYDNVGSFLWETGGETTHPSINDQIASGIGGSFLGEALFRMASLVLEGDGDNPGLWRELGAAALSPPTGINRLAFEDRFKPVFPSHNPATLWRLRLGLNLNTNVNDPVNSNTINHNEATADFIMAYGLPGKPGYRYTRPFDYFHFELTTLGNADNPIDNIMIRGLLLGKDYEAGKSYRGIWGLYGGYDYISPQIFRVSSTSVSLGTTFQWWLSRAVALQGSVLGGVGYAAAGNVTQVGDRDYHYGVAPQGLLALRLILGDMAMFDLTGRAYYLTGMGGDDPGGTETIDRLNMGFTFRIYGRHALGIHYIASLRDAHYPDRADSHQTTGTVSIAYTFLGAPGFGAVEWRSTDSR